MGGLEKLSFEPLMIRPCNAIFFSGEGNRITEPERDLRKMEKALAETAALLMLRKKGCSDMGGISRLTAEGANGTHCATLVVLS